MKNSIEPWREHLTDDERALVERAEAAKAAWLPLHYQRAAIMQRARIRVKRAAWKEKQNGS